MADTDILLTVDLDASDALNTADKLHKEVDRIFENRKGKQSSALTGVQTQMKQTLRQIKEVQSSLAQARQINVMGNDARNLNEVMENLKKLGIRYGALKSAREEALDTGSADFFGHKMSLEEIEAEISKVTEAYEVLQERAKQELELDELNDKLKQQIIRHDEILQKEKKHVDWAKRLRELYNGVRTSITRLLSAMRSLLGVVRGLATRARSTNTSLGKMVKTLLLTGLGMRSIFALYNKLRSAVITGFNNMLDSSKKLKDQFDRLQNSLLRLKNSIASVLQPIVSVAVPYLEKVSDYMSDILDQAARFVAAAMGQKYYMRAIQQTGRAAEKTRQQLSGLDNLNILNGKSMFEEVEIDPDQYNIWEKFAEILSKMREYGRDFGTLIVDKLTSINWDTISDGVTDLATGITDFVNGLLDTEGLGKKIGDFFANLTNTVVNFGKTLVSTFDFGKAGQQLSDSVNEFVRTFNWDALGELIGGFLKGAVDFAYEFAFGVDIDELSKKISDTINKIIYKLNTKDITGKTGWQKMGGVISRIFTLIWQIFEHVDWAGLVQGVVDMFKEAWDKTPPELKLKLGKIVFWGITTFTFAEGIKLALRVAITKLFTGAIGSGTGASATGVLAEAFGSGQKIVQAICDGLTSAGATVMLYNAFSDLWNSPTIQGVLNGVSVDQQKEVSAKIRALLEKKFRAEHPDRVKSMGNGQYSVDYGNYDIFEETNKLLVEYEKNVKALGTDAAWKLIEQQFADIDESVEDAEAELNAFKQKASEIVRERWKEKGWLNEFGFTELGKKQSGYLAKYNEEIQAEIQKLKDSITNTGDTIKSGIKQLPNLDEYFKQGEDLGEALPSGIVSGLQSKLAEVRSVMGELASAMQFGVPSIVTGAVVPQNTTFSSALSSNTSSTSVAQSTPASNNQEIVLNLDGREFLRAMVKQNDSYKKQHGGLSALA